MSRPVSRRGVLIGGAAAGAALTLGAGRPPKTDRTRRRLALRGVTVIDATRRRPQPNSTILIEGDRIIAVGRRDEIPVRHNVTVIDLPGRYVIPGLCEMHAHSIGTHRISPPLYLANGVTTVREMSGSDVVSQWRKDIQRGTLAGPRWTIASTIIDGSPSLLAGPDDPDSALLVTRPSEARAAVRRVKAEGADFAKIYSRLSPEAFAAVADEARRQGLPLAGHCPDRVAPTQAARLGQRSIEHVHSLWCATSTRDRQVRKALDAITIGPGDYAAWFRQFHPAEWLATSHYSPRRAATLFDRLNTSGTWVTPTLSMHLIVDRPEDLVRNDPRLKYIPAADQEWWQWAVDNIYLPGRRPAEIKQQRELFDRRLRFIGAMRRAGVRLLPGSEAGFIYAYPGFSLHEELALLVRAGLTPLEAIGTATLEPARYLGVERDLGSIHPGRLADLVVLDADPLADIRNTTKINTVVTGGRLITSTQRKRMLADVERAAATPDDTLPAAAVGCGCHAPRHTTFRTL
ncbi:amidohydrolase family protein [Actinomadura pelletieri DSM 43383]|uniref:Amidohydrolase family protein n=1 Tax=Actinomadura pelletieri DSM 43383 TaxID=1120940 RepID=A0A495QAI9_9ACTN|nr:amidohydrolase family protein [Actinomadura pelletieri]RKS68351.1 amidohydrolase family protein [Actinomadura pelletieri DSM 43383]